MTAPVLRLRVSNWRRWQRAKRIGVAVLIAAALLAAGGTEWDPATEPTGDLGLAWLLTIAAGCLIWNIERSERRLRSVAMRDV